MKKARKKKSEETKQLPDLNTMRMLDISATEFKITVINRLRALFAKLDNMQN